MRKLVAKLRWLLLVPLSVASWYLAFFAGLVLLAVIESFCPPKMMLSGFCHASWYAPALDAAMAFAAGLSAVFVVTAAVITAPEKRVLVGKLAFVIGFLAASYVAYETNFWAGFLAAIISGAITVYALSKRYGSSAS